MVMDHDFTADQLYFLKFFLIDNFIETFVVLILPISWKIYIFNVYHAAFFKISSRAYSFTLQR